MSTLDLRRLRQNEHIRALTRDVHVRLEQLIQPLFVAEAASQISCPKRCLSARI
jgi:delta-aminolevulinic acid dehydratase/porphobilinogen synthase